MSFTSDAKRELMHLDTPKCCRLAETAALFAVNGHLSIAQGGVSLTFQTMSLPLVRKLIASVKALYGVDVEIVRKQQQKLHKKNLYTVTIRDKAHAIINELGLMDETKGFAQDIDSTLLIKECDQRAFLRGVFLASGSINHPRSSSYHAEMTVPSRGFAEALIDLMKSFDIPARMHEKKRGLMVYIKESEKIADLLRVTGATKALLTFEDERIKRDFVNSITRVMNMELANQNKTLEAADKQLKDIAVVENLLDPSQLPDTLHEAIFLRKKYPESSLSELSELSAEHFRKRVSKSGLNHRFRNLHAMAMEVLDEYND